MPITRREFISKLFKVAIPLAIPPAIIDSLTSTQDAIGVTTSSIPEYPPLTLKMLEEAYFAITYGYQEPDLLLLSADCYSEFVKLLYDSCPLNAARYLTPDNDITLIHFNNSAVTFSRALPFGSWMYVNTLHPKEPKYSGFFSKGHPSPRPFTDIKTH